MKIINHEHNCKLNLMISILKTNNNLVLYQIWDYQEIILDAINDFENDDFYELLTIFNHTNYIGYFFIKHKLELIDNIDNHKDNNKDNNKDNHKDKIIFIFNKWIKLLKETKEFTEILRVEKLALNLLLEKMILKGHNIYNLNDLEKIKINLFEGNDKLKNRCFCFKTKIICSKNIERDLYQTLYSVSKNEHNLSLKDVIYLKENYYAELSLISSAKI